jgi:hypothetical protein
MLAFEGEKEVLDEIEFVEVDAEGDFVRAASKDGLL